MSADWHHWRGKRCTKGVNMVGSDDTSVMYSVYLTYPLLGRQQGHGHSHRCRSQLWGEVSQTVLNQRVLWKSCDEDLDTPNTQTVLWDLGWGPAVWVSWFCFLWLLDLHFQELPCFALSPGVTFQIRVSQRRTTLFGSVLSTALAAQGRVWSAFLALKEWSTSTWCAPTGTESQTVGGS